MRQTIVPPALKNLYEQWHFAPATVANGQRDEDCRHPGVIPARVIPEGEPRGARRSLSGIHSVTPMIARRQPQTSRNGVRIRGSSLRLPLVPE